MGALTEDEVLALFESCSNVGRWGPDDEHGTLNLITPEVRLAAAGTVRTGVTVSLGRDLTERKSAKNPIPIVHRMLFDGAHDEIIGTIDSLDIAPHGWEVTHLDATGHIFFRGRMWNGRTANEQLAFEGMRYGSVYAHREGIVTRGVLLDIPRLRGLPYLPADTGIHAEELDAAEARFGVRVREGDALLVRSGVAPREAAEGETAPALMPGIEPDTLPWMRDRGVAMYGGDITDRGPSGYPQLPVPIHQVGMVAMGLCLLDNVELEALADHCAATNTYEFLLVVAPVRAPMATGVPVNPIAIF
ncbi:MAG: cyclase family protein [Chloroflexota bacterium]